MTDLKVRKIGNSLGVILPAELLERLHATEGSTLSLVETEDGQFQLTGYDPEFARKMEIARSVIQRYPNTLRELAK